jgi:hypothetical protein
MNHFNSQNQIEVSEKIFSARSNFKATGYHVLGKEFNQKAKMSFSSVFCQSTTNNRSSLNLATGKRILGTSPDKKMLTHYNKNAQSSDRKQYVGRSLVCQRNENSLLRISGMMSQI